MSNVNKKKIVLGMSGGVDSSVSAYLLKKQGYEVIGLFMQNWDTILNNDINGHLKGEKKQCNVQKDFSDAKKVADKLKIKLYRIEFIKKYWENVFKYLLNEYKNGRTPNPDILCNKYIKFSEFAKYAKKKFKCDLFAMGHYANIKTINGIKYLAKSKSQENDQTYFLCWLTQEQINNVVFPIGMLTKTKVREIAKKQNIPTWNRDNSTGVCFIGERKFKEFLNNYIPYKNGDIYDIVTNKKIGKHQGMMFFTIGQNKGIGLGGQHEKYFVCKKNIKKNILYVCNEKNKEKYLSSTKCIVKKINWINKKKPKTNKIDIRFRHRQQLVPGKIITNKKQTILIYKKTLSVTPGQFAVFYKKDICLGGGIVQSIIG